MTRLNNTIRGYELKELLGEGGFGAVYRAYQTAVKRDVALKVILPQYANHPDFIRNFEAEAQIIARLEHLHIVSLYDYWREPSSAYLVMRFLRGGSLRTLIKKGPLSLDLTARILDQVCAALHTAHRNKIIHRDIKPDNILLDEEQNAFLSDFGIAKDLEDAASDEIDDELTGSPAYLSPEQAMSLPVSPQSDIYSLGIVTFEMLTGVPPYSSAKSMMEIIFKQINEPLPPLHTYRPDLPDTLDLLLQRATDKNPAARYLDASNFASEFRQALAQLKGDTSYAAQSYTHETSIDFISTAKITQETIITFGDNPYKGLRPFEEADAHDFYGRGELIRDLLNHLEKNPFLAVIGPSGSGKSSVVKAGLIPALRQGALPMSEQWFIAEMVPSHNPFQELESALLSVGIRRIDQLQSQIRQDEQALLKTLNHILPPNTTLLLFIDQFEELFTLLEDEPSRIAFLNSLLLAVTTPNSPLRLIITLRADFYDRPLHYAGFGELLRKHSELVLPLSSEEMAQAILRPAENAGLMVEPALVSAIITELSQQPGALPLLQYALTEVYERRQGNILSFAAYHASGGVLGALARRAEEIYVELDAHQQSIARQIFLRLVSLGEGTEDTRRRIDQAELFSIEHEQAAIEEVLAIYSKYRLFTFDNNPVTRNPTVEVAHEALIREWERLRNWLDESRDELRLQQRLATAAQEWQNHARDRSFLASGARLQQFESLLNSDNIALNDLEESYARASLAEAQRQEDEEAARTAHEKTLEKRAFQRLQAALAIFLTLALIASLLAFAAYTARGRARENEQIAQQNEATAVIESQLRTTAEAQAIDQRNLALGEASRVLAVLSQQQLSRDPVQSLNLAIQALPSAEISRPYVAEAEFALTEAIKNSLERAYFDPFNGSSLTQVAIHDNNLAIAGQGLALTTTDLESPTFLGAHTATVSDIEWSSSGLLLSFDPTLINVWQGNGLLATYNSAINPITCAGWLPNSDRIVICEGASLQLWEPSTDSINALHRLDSPITAIAAAPNGRYIAAWNSNSPQIAIADINTESITALTLSTGDHSINSVDWADDSNGLAIALSDFHAYYWPTDADSSETITLAGHTAMLDGVQFVDSEHILTWSDDATVRLWSVMGEEIAQFSVTGNPSEINGIALSPDSSRLLIWQNDGTSSLWDMQNHSQLARLQDQQSNLLLAAWRDNRYLVTTDIDFSIRLWDSENASLLSTLYGHKNRVKGLQWLDERHLLSYSQDGTVRVWELFTSNGLASGKGLLHVFSGHRGQIEYARWLDDNTIISSGRDGTARQWSLDSGEMLILPNDSGERWRIVWSPDGQNILRYLDDANGEVWQLNPPTKLYDITDSIASEAAFWNEAGIFIGQDDGTVLWFDAATGQALGQLDGHNSRINDAQYIASSRLLATAGSDNQIHLWQIPNAPNNAPLSPLHTLSSIGRQPLRLTWNRDGTRLLSGGFNGDVTLWDISTQDELLFLTGNRDFPVRSTVQFSPNEDYIAAPIDNEIFVWNLEGQLIFRTSDDNGILGIEWKEIDGRLRLLAWGINGFVRIWDIETGVAVWQAQDSNRVQFAAFNSDATQVLGVGGTGNILIWQAWPNLNTLITSAEACCQTRSIAPEMLSSLSLMP